MENVVATGDVKQSFDLVKINTTFDKTEYNPDRFPGLVYRIKVPKTSTLIFRTGKMVCTGSRSEEMAVIAINKVVKELRKGGIKIKNKPICKVQNIVASVDLGGQIDLEEVANELISDDFLDSFSPEIGVMAATTTAYGSTMGCTDSCGATTICC